MAWYDLAADMHMGFRASYYRTFGVPRIARLLAETGQIKAEPLRRAVDTGLIMYELIDAGTDTPRGRQVIRMLNRIHGCWNIEAEDFLYVLCTFIVVPVRWIDDFGWRSCTQIERQAVTDFYREVGRLMGIAGLPHSYADAARALDDYEAANVAYSPEGAALMADTQRVLAAHLPAPLRPFTDRITALYLTDQLCAAVGIHPPSRPSRTMFRGLMWTRRQIVRRRPPPSEPRFTPGQPTPDVYPAGYQLPDLGPRE